MISAKEKIVIAVSGSGRSLEHLIQKAKEQDAAFQIAGVISSRPNARACLIAKEANIPLWVLDFSKETIGEKLGMILGEIHPKLVVLAGFLKKFPTEHGFTTINIHPALLPNFGGRGMYGIHVHRAVVASGVERTGASVHYVNAAYDEGALIAQTFVAVDTKDPEVLAGKVFQAECALLSEVISLMLLKKLPLRNNEIYIHH